MNNPKLNREIDEELQTKFSKKMIHNLIKYKPPKLFAGCYVEIDLVQGKFFGDKTIGQLVGKSGERKEEFFTLTGIKPHIEDSKENPLLILSKYNVREIKLASFLGQRFKSSKSWSSSSIHKHFQQLQQKLFEEENELGTQELSQFEFEPISNDLKNAVGKMGNEYYSETQTLLEHSKEVAEECFQAATALSLDAQKAWKIAFYHDIGKVYLPYYLHDSQEVFKYIPDLEDTEIKECIETHHNSLISFESPYIALVSLLNKLISQSHFLENYSSIAEIEQLKINIKSKIDQLLAEHDLFKSYSYLSGQVLWIILSTVRPDPISEEKWSSLLSSIKECINNQLTESKVFLSDDEEGRFNISIYCLPAHEQQKALITKLRFNLNKTKLSV